MGVSNTSKIGITYAGSVLYTSTATIALNTWYHLAVVRNGTTAWTIFINGQIDGTFSNTVNISSTTFSVGLTISASGYFNGYVSNVRVANSAVYTVAFTPPTAPVTAATNTQLLLNFANAGIYDAAVQNNAITISNAQASTTIAKWSPTSMKFNGSTDYLSIPSGNQFTLGTGDFTIEAWIYPTTTAGSQQGVLGLSTGNSTGDLVFFWNAISNASKVQLQVYNGSQANSVATLSLNVWTYVAFSRTSGTVKIFLNGTLDNTVSFGDNCNKTACVVGRSYSGLNQEYFNGYIQDLRITKGVGRYTTSFTAPTAAFPTR
jgi:hypothetical protein